MAGLIHNRPVLQSVSFKRLEVRLARYDVCTDACLEGSIALFKDVVDYFVFDQLGRYFQDRIANASIPAM